MSQRKKNTFFFPFAFGDMRQIRPQKKNPHLICPTAADPKQANPIYVPKIRHNTGDFCFLGPFPFKRENPTLQQMHYSHIVTPFNHAKFCNASH